MRMTRHRKEQLERDAQRVADSMRGLDNFLGLCRHGILVEESCQDCLDERLRDDVLEDVRRDGMDEL